MARKNEFVSHLLDLLQPLGEITARGMFGGWGIYHSGKMCALVAFETFFVKVDDSTRDEFVALRLAPFEYETSEGKRSVMSYHTVPVEALDSSELLCEWTRKGSAAAAKKPKAPKRKPAK
jgi:DNA transformation protein